MTVTIFKAAVIWRRSVAIGCCCPPLKASADFFAKKIHIHTAIGAFVTALIHSSSAMTAIVLTMAANGSLTWELSAAIVLGSNIGSTIDAVVRRKKD